MTENRPRLFIGSSAEALPVAEAIQYNLHHAYDVTVWSQGAFRLNEYALESLLRQLDKSDFAIFVLSDDDQVASRRKEQLAPRDNVLFELGLFMGHLGRRKAFVVYRSDIDIKMLSDLAGITLAPYRMSNENLHAALGPACTRIKSAIDESSWLGKQTIAGEWHMRDWAYGNEEKGKARTLSEDAFLWEWKRPHIDEFPSEADS